MAYDSVRLCLESPHNLPPTEYRFHDGGIEPGRQEPDMAYAAKNAWERLTPQQLSDHVKHSTVVSYWLQRRVGWRLLLQMCVAPESDWTETNVPSGEERAEMQAA